MVDVAVRGVEVVCIALARHRCAAGAAAVREVIQGSPTPRRHLSPGPESFSTASASNEGAPCGAGYPRSGCARGFARCELGQVPSEARSVGVGGYGS
jgi:hypothetical protein